MQEGGGGGGGGGGIYLNDPITTITQDKSTGQDRMKDRGVEGDENKAPMCSTAEVGVGGREEDISNGGWDTGEVLAAGGGGVSPVLISS